jgi:hypothetical protein
MLQKIPARAEAVGAAAHIEKKFAFGNRFLRNDGDMGYKLKGVLISRDLIGDYYLAGSSSWTHA